MAADQTLESGHLPGCSSCASPLELDDEHTLTIRHASDTDEDLLAALYRRMTSTDLHRRFFSGGLPPESFLERWVGLEKHGGLCLVAELRGPDGSELVGEAGYAPLSDGDVELGIAVDPHHRGWLGPWLLDSLFTHARDKGIENIQALVMADNRAMMALAKRRGYAVLDHPEFSKVRLSMSTRGHVPTWPKRKTHPRVVVETNRSRWRGEAQLRAAGFDVAICRGPCVTDGSCPVMSGEHCPLLDGADAVIVDLPDDDPLADELIKADRLIHPGLRLLRGSVVDGEGAVRRVAPIELLAGLDDLLTSEPTLGAEATGEEQP